MPSEAVVVNAAGKFLIPGLCDMHVHLFDHVDNGPPGEFYFPLLIAKWNYQCARHVDEN